MSGVGEALALVSLLVAVAQSYKKACWQPYSRFRNCQKVVRRYMSHLDNQRVIYETHCELLLKNAVGEAAANAILTEIGTSEWRNDRTGKQVSDLLGRRLEACLRTIKQIETLLEDVHGQTQKLRLLLGEEHAREPINNHRNTIQGIKSKLVVAFSKSGLQENLDELTAFNVELSSLCSIDKKPLTVDTTRSGDLRPFIEKARADRMIAETSQAAFDMLGSSCSEHQEHQANLNMLATCAIDDYSITSRIELNLALAGGQMQCEPVWLELKMVFREIKDCNRITGRSDGMSNWTARLKIALADPDALFILRTKERTTGLQNAGILPDQEAPDPIETATTTCGSNGSGQELCSLLRRCCLQQSSKHPVDFKVRSVKWHVSVRPARTDPTARQPPVSLRSLLDTLSQQDRLASLSIPQRVRLAKLLSIGFLRHHSTDWGRPAWQCHRIFFFDVCCDAKNKPLQLPSPHVSALICGLNGTPPTQPSNMPTIAGVKGSRFFHLGLLLIEIAHLKTWEDLKLRLVHGVHEHETKIDEVSQVKRLSKSRLSLLPGQYHDVAERLIEGKFSYGDDLRNVESQAEFYQQIIDPLENLEQDFQRMGFAV